MEDGTLSSLENWVEDALIYLNSNYYKVMRTLATGKQSSWQSYVTYRIDIAAIRMIQTYTSLQHQERLTSHDQSWAFL